MKPGIFIGIGGSGVKSLSKLKAKIYNSYKDKKDQDYNQLHEQLHTLLNQDGHNNILQPIINNNNNENNNNNQN